MILLIDVISSILVNGLDIIVIGIMSKLLTDSSPVLNFRLIMFLIPLAYIVYCIALCSQLRSLLIKGTLIKNLKFWRILRYYFLIIASLVEFVVKMVQIGNALQMSTKEREKANKTIKYTEQWFYIIMFIGLIRLSNNMYLFTYFSSIKKLANMLNYEYEFPSCNFEENKPKNSESNNKAGANIKKDILELLNENDVDNKLDFIEEPLPEHTSSSSSVNIEESDSNNEKRPNIFFSHSSEYHESFSYDRGISKSENIDEEGIGPDFLKKKIYTLPIPVFEGRDATKNEVKEDDFRSYDCKIAESNDSSNATNKNQVNEIKRSQSLMNKFFENGNHNSKVETAFNCNKLYTIYDYSVPVMVPYRLQISKTNSPDKVSRRIINKNKTEGPINKPGRNNLNVIKIF